MDLFKHKLQTNYHSNLAESSPLKRQNSKNYDINAKHRKLSGLSEYTKTYKQKFFKDKKGSCGSKMNTSVDESA
jgi:hypothetical protein